MSELTTLYFISNNFTFLTVLTLSVVSLKYASVPPRMSFFLGVRYFRTLPLTVPMAMRHACLVTYRSHNNTL